MAIIPNKNLEIVSAQEKVKSKKDQMLENIKLEMLKDLKLDEKLVKRNALADKIADKIINKKSEDIDLTEFF